MRIKKNGFTLIELLVAMTIMAMLMAIALFSYQGARKSARDGRRRADLEQIRSALEMCRTDADDGSYPADIYSGDPPEIRCAVEGIDQTYLTGTPKDPSTSVEYYYSRNVGTDTYTLCAFLETGGEDSCGDTEGCGTDRTCNYKTSNP
jgi:prepilin-type N-terminal cleavage/methylation domain-containing protein